MRREQERALSDLSKVSCGQASGAHVDTPLPRMVVDER